MKDLKAKHVRFHAAVQCGPHMVTDLDTEIGPHAAKLNGSAIDVLPQGAVMFTFAGKTYLVPWSNVHSMEIAAEAKPLGKKASA